MSYSEKNILIKISSYVDIIFGWKLTIIWVLAYPDSYSFIVDTYDSTAQALSLSFSITTLSNTIKKGGFNPMQKRNIKRNYHL